MRSAAAIAAAAGADLLDINMGCPVRKVCKTGAGAALLSDHELAVRIATAAIEGSGPARDRQAALGARARRPLGRRARGSASPTPGVAAIALHPRTGRRSSTRAAPTTRLVRELIRRVDVPVVVSGGLRQRRARRVDAYAESGAAARDDRPRSARQPVDLRELTGRRRGAPRRDEVVAELLWVIDRAAEHLGEQRATAYLRKFYPWYLERLGLPRRANEPFQRADALGTSRSSRGCARRAPPSVARLAGPCARRGRLAHGHAALRAASSRSL